MIERRSTNTNPMSSPGMAALAAANSSLVDIGLVPPVSIAALTDAMSPTIATLPPTRAKAARPLASSGFVKVSSSTPS